MTNNQRLFVALRDATAWIILTSLVGQVQIVVFGMAATFVSDIRFDLFDWFKNGAIVAFSMALVSSIFFDTYFQKVHKQKANASIDPAFEEYFGGLYYKLLPWLIVFMVTFSTMLDLFVEGDKIQRTYLVNTQVAAIILAYAYTFYFKFCSFYLGLNP